MKIALPALVTIYALLPARTFEVASIREIARYQMAASIGTDPGSFNVHNISLRRCIEWALEFAGFNDPPGLNPEPGRESLDRVVIDAVNRVPTEN